MKPAYWIGLLALVGGLLGYLASRSQGWLEVGTGIVVGMLVGTVIYARSTREGSGPTS